MSSVVPLATVLVLPDLQPLAARIRRVLADLGSVAVPDPDHQAERTGRVPVFRGDLAQALRLDRELRAAGLTTSLNRLS